MKKVAIIGTDIPMGAQIEKLFKEQNLEIVVNNHEIKNLMREQYLQTEYLLEPIKTFLETKFYDKPKSKYHK